MTIGYFDCKIDQFIENFNFLIFFIKSKLDMNGSKLFIQLSYSFLWKLLSMKFDIQKTVESQFNCYRRVITIWCLTIKRMVDFKLDLWIRAYDEFNVRYFRMTLHTKFIHSSYTNFNLISVDSVWNNSCVALKKIYNRTLYFISDVNAKSCHSSTTSQCSNCR